MEFLSPKTIEDFILSLKQFNCDGTHYFRGQANASWEIIPGIARNKNIRQIHSLLAIEIELIDKFKAMVEQGKKDNLIKIVSGGYHDSWKLLMAAQHYGLPTRFLDFTHDKFVALEFAAADLSYLDKDGALIVYSNVNSIQENVDSTIFKTEFKDSHKDFFLQAPSYGNGTDNEKYLSERRKRIQGSKFLYRNSANIFRCLKKDEAHRDNMTIIHIPRRLKPDIINYLIHDQKMAFDLFAGRNILDYYAAFLKTEFYQLNR